MAIKSCAVLPAVTPRLRQGGGISGYFDSLLAEIRANSSKVDESSGAGMFDYRQCPRTTCNPLIKLLNPATRFFY